MLVSIQTVDFGKFALTKFTKCISVNAEIMQAKLYFYTETWKILKSEQKKTDDIDMRLFEDFFIKA